MKKVFLATLLVVGSVSLIYCFAENMHFTTPDTPKIKWMSWTEAMEANKKEKKKILVDVFTDWCGWCKVMDRETFMEDNIADYVNTNFYAVKFNAEQRDSIVFNNHVFHYLDQNNGRGVNELAYSLLDGNLAYPTIVYLNENYERVMVSPGYKKSDQLMQELKYNVEEIYKKNISWEKYQAGQ